MVYRGAADQDRVAQLQRLIGSEPELLRGRSEARRRYDAACDEVDRLVREEAPLNAIETAQATRERLVADELQWNARITEVTAARAELAQLLAARGADLRAGATPGGADLRALDAEIAKVDADVAHIDRLIDAVEPAHSVLLELAELVRQVPGTAFTALQTTGQVVGKVLGSDAEVRSDRSILRARLVDAVLPAAHHALRRYLVAASDLDEPVTNLRRLLEAPIAAAPETSALAVEAADVAEHLGARLHALGVQRTQLLRRRDELVAAQGDVVSHS